MEIYERLRYLREHLDLTTRVFGAAINMSGGAITNMEKGQRNITDRTIRDICREFNINENWLRTGEGEIFAQPKAFDLDSFLEKQEVSESELRFFRRYFEMDKETRHQLIDNLAVLFDKSE